MPFYIISNDLFIALKKNSRIMPFFRALQWFNPLTVIIDKFRILFKILTKKKLTDMLYCLLLRFPNFQKDTLQYKEVILHGRKNVRFSHVV